MNPSAEILKKCLLFLKNQAFLSINLEVRPDYVKFGQAPLMLYAGRSPPLEYKESGRRFCFSAPIAVVGWEVPIKAVIDTDYFSGAATPYRAFYLDIKAELEKPKTE